MSHNLLALSTTGSAGGGSQKKFAKLMSGGIEIDHLIDSAINEGLAGLLFKNLLKFKQLNALDAANQEKLRAHYYRVVYNNINLSHNLKGILQRLNQKQIPVVLLQGIDLLQHVYDDIGLRPLSDIDLWVLDKDYSALVHTLISLDYKRDTLYPLTFRKGSTVLDLHTHILWADRIRARKLLLPHSQEHIFRRTRFINFEGQQARCLERYDQVLYLSLHLLKHNVRRLIWLVDIHSLIADWEVHHWKALLDRARTMGQVKCVVYICYLLKILADFQPPTEICSLLQRVGMNPIERELLKQRIKKESLPEWSTLVLFSSGKGLVNGLLFIMETLFPRPDVLRQVFADFPDLSVSQLYTRRLRQLLDMLKTTLH